MSVYIGNQQFGKVYLGSSEVKNIYLGSELLFSNSSTDSDSLALFARMTGGTPSDNLKTLINTTIVNLKSYGLWNKIDVMRFPCVHTLQAALLNWKGDFCNGIAINSPTWAAKVGYCSASGKYVSSEFNPTAFGGNYTRYDVSLGFYTPTNTTTDTGFQIYSPTSAGTYLRPKNSALRVRAYIHNTVANIAQPMIGSTIGLLAAQRETANSNMLYAYKNGSLLSSISDTTAAMPNSVFREIFNAYSGYQSFVYYGGALTSTEHSNLYLVVTNFINNVGGTF